MIEFRWLEKSPQRTDAWGRCVPARRVLQYREWRAGAIPGNVEPDWVDVPVVYAWGNSGGDAG